MADYEKKILNALLDSYEGSLLSRGENKVAVRIAFRFTEKSLPAYFDESSTAYEEIHAALRELENRGFITIQWKGKKVGHIVEKVFLREEAISEVYRHLRRTPQSLHISRMLSLLDSLTEEFTDSAAPDTGSGAITVPVTLALISWLRQRLTDHLPVKEFIDITRPTSAERLIRTVALVEQNVTPCYIREFSIQNFGDSKAFEAEKSLVKKVFRRFDSRFADADEKEILAEYGIYQTPNYVYLKGEGVLYTQTAEEPAETRTLSTRDGTPFASGSTLSEPGRTLVQKYFPINILHQGIGLAGEDLDTVQICGTTRTKKVITIENLTSFFQWQEPNSLIIYLGGYHNASRRRLLAMLHEQLPDATYLHFGDIDAGGFEIYLDLCRKTGIPFQTYHMGVEELEHYRAYGKPLTDHDRSHLHSLQQRLGPEDPCFPVLSYMLEQDIKLEQECIRPESEVKPEGKT